MENDDYNQDYAGEPIPFLEIRENENQDVEFVLNPRSEEYLRQMTSKKADIF